MDAGLVFGVVGDEEAVLIEFDFESDTVSRFGLPETHRHDDRLDRMLKHAREVQKSDSFKDDVSLLEVRYKL